MQRLTITAIERAITENFKHGDAQTRLYEIIEQMMLDAIATARYAPRIDDNKIIRDVAGNMADRIGEQD